MSEENLEVVRRVYDAAGRRDAAAVLALYDPGVELDMSRLQAVGLMGGEGRRYRGHEGLRSFFREWHEAWDNVEYAGRRRRPESTGVNGFASTRMGGRSVTSVPGGRAPCRSAPLRFARFGTRFGTRNELPLTR